MLRALFISLCLLAVPAGVRAQDGPAAPAAPSTPPATTALAVPVTPAEPVEPGPWAVPASVMLPRDIPVQPIADWTPADGRDTISLDVDGVTLRGFSYAGSDATMPTLLFFEGDRGRDHACDAFFRAIAKAGPRVVVFDYRGYGFSGGRPDVLAFERDGLRIFDSLSADGTSRVAVMGYSLGTGIATSVALRRKSAGLLLAAPFANAKELLPVYMTALGVPASDMPYVMPSYGFAEFTDNAKRVAMTRVPLLVIHGSDDALVPIDQGREVFEASRAATKRMVEVLGAKHDNVLGSPAALYAIDRFIALLR